MSSPRRKYSATSSDDDWPSDGTALDDSGVPTYYSEKRRKQPIFGLKRARPCIYGLDPFNYEQKYAEDAPYEEMNPNARVWRTYLDECSAYDTDMVETWRDGLDVLLVFAGLFSAVVSAFVVEASQRLSVDYTKVTANLLLQVLAHDDGGTVYNGTSTFDIDSDFHPNVLDSWVSGLWFVSLTLSLTTAAAAVLIKQWIHEFMSVPSGSPRDRSRVRQFRYTGLQAWRVPAIIGFLPMLMHLSLAIFFVGMVVFLYPLNSEVAAVIGVIALLTFVGYITSNILPIIHPQCPYRTPLSTYIYSAWNRIYHAIHLSVHNRHPPITSLKVAEENAVAQNAHATDISALTYLVSMSSNISVRSVVLQALSALPLSGISNFEAMKPSSMNILGECLKLRDECLERRAGFKSLLLPEYQAKYDRLQRVCFRFYKSVGVGVHALLDHISLDSTPRTEILAPCAYTRDPLALVKANLLGPESEFEQHEAIVWLHLFHNAMSDDVLLSFRGGTDGGNFDLFLHLIEIFLEGGPAKDTPVLTLRNLVFRPHVQSFANTISISDNPDAPHAHHASTLKVALRSFMFPFLSEVVRFGLSLEPTDRKSSFISGVDPQLSLLLHMSGTPIVQRISAYQSSASRTLSASLIQQVMKAVSRWIPKATSPSLQDRRNCSAIVGILLRSMAAHQGRETGVDLHWVDLREMLSVIYQVLLTGAIPFDEYLAWEARSVVFIQEVVKTLCMESSPTEFCANAPLVCSILVLPESRCTLKRRLYDHMVQTRYLEVMERQQLLRNHAPMPAVILHNYILGLRSLASMESRRRAENYILEPRALRFVKRTLEEVDDQEGLRYLSLLLVGTR